MKILVSGASGLVGRAVIRSLSAKGYQVLGLHRNSTLTTPYWNIAQREIELGSDKDIDVIINLAGENIAEGRWTAARKERILRSRVDGTCLLAEFFANAEYKPKIMISASAVGIYGDRGEEELTEASNRGEGFLADVGSAWEAATEPAAHAGIRVVHLRFGMVLCTEGGALKKILLPFKLGMGGVIGSGRQYMSWISLHDVTEIMDHIIRHKELRGPVNMVAPNPVTNRVFTKTLGRVLRRPTIFPVPQFLIRLIFGEMGKEIFFGAKVKPIKLLESGYSFLEPDIKSALIGNLGIRRGCRV